VGGPVQRERGFVLHTDDYKGDLEIGGGVGLTATREVLETMAKDEGHPRRRLLALGYAGWGAGQLEEEIAEGAWYVVPAQVADVFTHDHEHLWRSVLRRQPGELAWVSTRPVDPDLN
jgi:putative transcriptional regulator